MAGGLHVAWHGTAGPRVLLVHGSFVHPDEVWERQLPLAQHVRLGIVHRRGYGSSPDPMGRVDFERDAEDVAALLDEPAHVAGHSYGGIVALLAAAARAGGIRSLLAIEPPCFAHAADDPAVRELRGRLAAVFAEGGEPRALYAAFLRAWGFNAPSEHWLALQDERALASSAGERPPWEARIPVERLAAAQFSTAIVSGDWARAPQAARELAGRAFGAVCDALVAATGAERIVVPGANHSPQLLGRRFDALLLDWVARAEAASPR